MTEKNLPKPVETLLTIVFAAVMITLYLYAALLAAVWWVVTWLLSQVIYAVALVCALVVAGTSSLRNGNYRVGAALLGVVVVVMAAMIGFVVLITTPMPRSQQPAYNYQPTYGYQREPATADPGIVWVNGYYRNEGVYVPGHYRTSQDYDASNNWSSQGNVNPYTQQRGYRSY